MSVTDKIISVYVFDGSREIKEIDRDDLKEVGEDAVRFELIRDLRLYDYFFRDVSSDGFEIGSISGKVSFVIEGEVVPRLFEMFSDFKISRIEPIKIDVDEIESFELTNLQMSVLRDQILEDIVDGEIIADDFVIKVAYDL